MLARVLDYVELDAEMMGAGTVVPEILAALEDQRLPLGWREITEKQLAQSEFFHMEPSVQGHAQLWKDQDGNPLDGQAITISWYWWSCGETGIALVSDFHAGRVLAYEFGCDHQMEHITSHPRYGSQISADQCRVCGCVSVRPESR